MDKLFITDNPFALALKGGFSPDAGDLEEFFHPLGMGQQKNSPFEIVPRTSTFVFRPPFPP